MSGFTVTGTKGLVHHSLVRDPRSNVVLTMRATWVVVSDSVLQPKALALLHSREQHIVLIWSCIQMAFALSISGFRGDEGKRMDIEGSRGFRETGRKCLVVVPQSFFSPFTPIMYHYAGEGFHSTDCTLSFFLFYLMAYPVACLVWMLDIWLRVAQYESAILVFVQVFRHDRVLVHRTGHRMGIG